MTQQHDFKATLERVSNEAEHDFDWYFDAAHLNTIRFALRLADKVMQEPSQSMLLATNCGWHYSTVFKAMISQAIKEISQ